MSYLVLARKWRPKTFDDLVGQEHVSRTLSNAIVSGRIAHAFLFTGVRGVGKTTSARILAKSLNCKTGPTPKPCLTCDACVEIAAGNDIDVQEIDGASYNGVDEVRKLQESLPYRPSRDRFKVVIVDEVHMLSQSAWNAFLKTLEEPPSHVKFVFATTEAHKVPVTILSRCQRYDFKLMTNLAIAKHLRFVLENEGIQADDGALSLIAREAAGSMRDAMSLLDQAIAWGGSQLVGEQIAQVLGIAGRGMLLDLTQAIVDAQPERLLSLVAKLTEQGFDLVQVARDTLEVLRDLVVVKVCRDPNGLTQLTTDELSRVKAIVQAVSADDLMRLHLGFSKGFDQVVYAPQQRYALEMLLIRLALRPPLLPVDDLVNKVQALAKQVGFPSPKSHRGQLGQSQAKDFASVELSQKNLTHSTPFSFDQAKYATADSQLPPSRCELRQRSVLPQQTEEITQTISPNDRRSRAAQDTCQQNSAQQDSKSRDIENQNSPLHNALDATDNCSASISTASSPVSVPSSEALLSEQDAGQGQEHSQCSDATSQMYLGNCSDLLKAANHKACEQLTDDSQLVEKWREIIHKVAQQDQVLASVLTHVVPVRMNASVLQLQVEQDSFYADSLKNTASLELLSTVVRGYFNAPTQVQISACASSLEHSSRTVYERDEARRALMEKQHRERIQQHELVQAAVKYLDATVLSIKLASSE